MNDNIQDQVVLTEVIDNHILQITLNRPEVRNAFDQNMAVQLENVLDQFDADDNLRVAVLTGGGGTFSSGMDLKAAQRGEDAETTKRGPLGVLKESPKKPMIAAIEGHALGGGLELALACDLIVAASDVMVGLPEVRRALAPLAGGVMRLPERIPYHKALEFLLTGRTATAQEFAELGLVNCVAPPGKALEGAMELAQMIAGNGPVAVKEILALARQARTTLEPDMFPLQREALDRIKQSPDAAEGIQAFLEKREPVWQ